MRLQGRGSCAPWKGEKLDPVRTAGETNGNCGASPIHMKIKEKIVESTEQDTIHIFRTMRNTARVFKNKVSEEVVAIERRPGSKFEDVRDLVSGARGREVYVRGDPDYGIWSLGISAGLIQDIPTCEELVGRMEKEAEEMLNGGLTRKLAAKL